MKLRVRYCLVLFSIIIISTILPITFSRSESIPFSQKGVNISTKIIQDLNNDKIDDQLFSIIELSSCNEIEMVLKYKDKVSIDDRIKRYLGFRQKNSCYRF